jgi:chitin disaccharide deacetylase
MRRLIVNADDFGLTHGVSRGILSAHRHGIVTSSTVLVTQAVERETIREAFDSGLALGLHLNLTLGQPLTGARSLVDGAGRFIRDAQRTAAQASMTDVETELDAQVEKFLALVGQPPTHLDSHHHVGLYPPVREVVIGIAQRLGVPVRSQDDASRMRVRAAGLRTPDHFFGGSGPDAYWTPARTLAHLRRLPPGVSEFMTHPGHFDDALSFSRYGRQRETELVALGGASARGAIESLGITLAGFADL